MEDKEICAVCGRSVAMGSGHFVNRVPIGDDYETRKEMGYPYPEGGWICAECDDNERNAKSYPITGVSKKDLKHQFRGNKKALKKIEELDDADMQRLAEKMADDYLEQLYWQSLETIFRECFLEGGD